MTDFPIQAFNQARTWARDVGMMPWQATRYALCAAYRAQPVAPLPFLTLLGLLDDAALNAAQEETLCEMTGRQIAPLLDPAQHPPTAFGSLEDGRKAMREWLAPHVELWLDGHEAHDEAEGMSVFMCGLGRNLRRCRPNPRIAPIDHAERVRAAFTWTTLPRAAERVRPAAPAPTDEGA